MALGTRDVEAKSGTGSASMMDLTLLEQPDFPLSLILCVPCLEVGLLHSP